jgi:hypothetical protein
MSDLVEAAKKEVAEAEKTFEVVEKRAKKEVAEAEKKVAEAEKKVAEAKKEVAEAKKEVAEAEKKVEAAEKKVEAAEKEYKEAPGGFQKDMAEMKWKSANQIMVSANQIMVNANQIMVNANQNQATANQNQASAVAYLAAARTAAATALGQRPPLHPDSAQNETKLMFGQILEAVQKSDRATPQYSAALIGNKEKERLLADSRFLVFEKMVGEASVLTAEQVEELSTLESEHQVVAYITPFLEEIVKDTVSCSVINSEEYKWIKTSSEGTRYNEKPDLIVIHPAFITSKPPFNTSSKTLEEMRRKSDKYGVLADWKLRDFIGLTCEAKQKIDNKGFGEVINYGTHLCFGERGPVATRLMLFDMQTFWLVESVKGSVANVVACEWSDPGSKNLLHDFVRQPALPKLLNDACKHFNLTVASDSFLGAGAFGFVFHAQRVDGASVALKIVLNPNVERLETEMSKTLHAKNVCPAEVIGLEKDGFHTFEDGAALLMSEVGEDCSKLSPQSIMDSLQKLHASGIAHGDARLENVVCVNGKPRWIDFTDSAYLVDTPRVMKREMVTLMGYLSERFNGYKALH